MSVTEATDVTDPQAPSPTWPWPEFLRWFLCNWNQGEHVTMIGTTGCGKTTTAREFLPLRSHVVAFGVKGRDDTMEEFLRDGYLRIRRWDGAAYADYVVLWPEILGSGDVDAVQRPIFRQAMDSIFAQGGWCVFLDEVVYLAETLRLERELKFLLNQGRSSGISIVAATQRPAFIPLAFYDQATHLFIWKDNDRRNIARLAELTGLAREQVQQEIPTLARRELLYVNKDTGFRVRTTVEV